MSAGNNQARAESTAAASSFVVQTPMTSVLIDATQTAELTWVTSV
jgi:hypothetical protein